MCAGLYTCLCTYMWRPEVNLRFSSSEPCPQCFFQIGSLTGLEFTKSGRLPVCPSLTLQHWDSKGAGFWRWTQVLLFASHSLYWLSHCPSRDSVFSGCDSWHYLLSSHRNFQSVTAYSPFHSPRHATSLFRRRSWGLGISNGLPKDLLGVEAAFRVTHNGLSLFLTWEGDNAETGICLLQDQE